MRCSCCNIYHSRKHCTAKSLIRQPPARQLDISAGWLAGWLAGGLAAKAEVSLENRHLTQNWREKPTANCRAGPKQRLARLDTKAPNTANNVVVVVVVHRMVSDIRVPSGFRDVWDGIDTKEPLHCNATSLVHRGVMRYVCKPQNVSAFEPERCRYWSCIQVPVVHDASKGRIKPPHSVQNTDGAKIKALRV